MIVILADDFSGAAELAGIAAARGFKAEVQTRFDPSSDAEVIAVDTDTRLRSEPEAARIVGGIATQVIAAKPSWIFKKTDSALRGHVRVEIEGILAATGQCSCLFIPANPSKDRVISQGRYLVNGVPLDQTVFAHDPDHPRRSAVVAELLGHAPRIRVPDVTSMETLLHEASSLTPQTLPAGAADFFTALIGGCVMNPRRHPVSRTLLVCGSLAAWDTERAQQMKADGFEVMILPETAYGGELDDGWVQQARHALQGACRLMIAIGRPAQRHSAATLTGTLVHAAARISAGLDGMRIALEGGATAQAFIRVAGWSRFEVVPEGITGVGSLRPADRDDAPLLWIKPGSYPWPPGVFA
uniref:Four-carbon acid sugar kinase N-terminal domain-containing protein n=1 Tax=uncultured Verrucomicrobiota bacterium TaxID=156588 RepID=D2DXV4_9BACT|nr:hypothetical protein [uncultured Verrucomicrobiota bacterium]